MDGSKSVWITTDEARAEIQAWPAAGGTLHRVIMMSGEAHDVAEAVVKAYPSGTALLADRVDLANALQQRGGALVRHVHVMRHDLATIPEDGWPQRLTLRPWQAGDTDALAAVLVGAYGPGHPDARSGDLNSAASDLLHTAEDPDNPLIATATKVAVHDNQPVGAALVVFSDHVRGFTGPWLMNVFRSPLPTVAGAGAATSSPRFAAFATRTRNGSGWR